MESYSLHFERMSNVDLQPFHLPVSRLSPAKSNSSIVDHFAHHQHGKGDSAYSSFSGGSTAPEYLSHLQPDDLQPSPFSHCVDLKYVKSIYNPAQVLKSDSNTMDQLYRSVEAISQQYQSNASSKLKHNVKHHNHNANISCHTNKKALAKQEAHLGATSQGVHPSVGPPPVPARLDSFIATQNLENSRVHCYSPEIQPQQPQLQQQSRSNNLPQLHAPRSEATVLDASTSSFSSEPAYPIRRASQPKGQHPPRYYSHLRDQTRVSLDPEKHFSTDNKSAAEQQLSHTVSQPSPQGTSHLEHLKLRQPSSSQTLNGDDCCSSSHFESGRKRAHSAYDWLGSEPPRASRPWNAGQSFRNSSIQHKGQFYFVTGVSKRSESGLRTHSATVCGSAAASESSTVLETYQLREKERCHSTMDNLFKPLQESFRTSSSTIPDEKTNVTSVSEDDDLSFRSWDLENRRLSLTSTQSCKSSDAFEEINMMPCPEIGRHTANNPIFYCGPERNCPPHSTTQKEEVISLMSNEQPNYQKRGKQKPLRDLASDKISKETTPLLYHLTGASRAVVQPKSFTDYSIKGKEMIQDKTVQGDLTVNNNESPPKSDTRKNDGEDVISACNTLDDSFKKYYKEKLKDAQSKVLKETSFKRRDLQLSRSHRMRQKPELRSTAIHSFSSSQDSETSTDTLTPSVTSEDTGRGSIKEVLGKIQKEKDKENEAENGKTANPAQPQVARIRGRKRFTQEQKKMCYSEPENLNLVGHGAPIHCAHRSFGNESDNLFAVEYEGEERVQHGEQGLVAARRKLFETKDQNFSASSTSKTNLKHLQHKALMEYMERKTGQKVAEPQQPASQVPSPSRQRHSLAGKPFDWTPRPFIGNYDDRKNTNKLHRPHSAGRILDSSTSSIRYSQFFLAQPGSDHYASRSSKPRSRERRGPTQGKSASVENLLDQQNPPSFFRNRSTSTPYTFECLQAHGNEKDPLPFISMETLSPQKTAMQEPLIKWTPEGQHQGRVVAPRGKSMEELGALKLAKPSARSKSSEQLDQLRRCSIERGGPDADKSNGLFFANIREGHRQDREKSKQYTAEPAAKEPETVVQKSTQGHAQNQTKKMPLQNSEPGEDTEICSRNSSRSNSPSSFLSLRARVHPGSHSPASGGFRSTPLVSETPSNPPSPKGLDGEMELKFSTSTPIQTTHPGETRPNASRARATSSVAGSERVQLVDEPSNDSPPPDSNSEVSLSCGITTDPSLWILPSDKENKDDDDDDDVRTEIAFDNESTKAVNTGQTSEASVSDEGLDLQIEEEKTPENEDMKSVENEWMKGRGTPEEETQNLERPPERPRWEELVETVVKADQSLARLFCPLANRKTALMLMEQLLSEDTLLMEEHYKKKQEQKGAIESPETAEWTESSPCPSVPGNLSPQCVDLQSNADVTEKRHLLVSYIEAHLRSLEEMRGPLQTDTEENVALGQALEALVHKRCQPVELERYNLFIGDLQRVVSLLLCLSARLARVQNALSNVDQHTDAEEKQSLDSRHRLLCKQREDAKDLKDNLDRRENLVSNFLSRQLTPEQLQDYRRFVQTKASLLIRQKDLEEKQKLGEEQLEALTNRLIL
ncbi:protein Shroom1 [Brachionichthys hirsutus]|uniref:protein Shroom1 n=1 Tax=Brachionichthys hirsutus TaxID=412623 RepID=UPI003604DD52